jgi:hypothetical protein
MMRFGRMPLFPMRTSEELREEGRQLNLERLISDIARNPLPPLKFEDRPWMKEMMNGPHSSEERREQHQQPARDGEAREAEF